MKQKFLERAPASELYIRKSRKTEIADRVDESERRAYSAIFFWLQSRIICSLGSLELPQLYLDLKNGKRRTKCDPSEAAESKVPREVANIEDLEGKISTFSSRKQKCLRMRPFFGATHSKEKDFAPFHVVETGLPFGVRRFWDVSYLPMRLLHKGTVVRVPQVNRFGERVDKLLWPEAEKSRLGFRAEFGKHQNESESRCRL